MTADQFMHLFSKLLMTEVRRDRTTLVDLHTSLNYPVEGCKSAYISVTFINLPTPRVKERRGGGAEAENNRMLFFVTGFNGPPFTHEPVDRVKVEQLVNNIGAFETRAPKMKTRTSKPGKIANYLATYINQVATDHPPNYTHEE